MRLADPARDRLCVLRAEVDDQNRTGKVAHARKSRLSQWRDSAPSPASTFLCRRLQTDDWGCEQIAIQRLPQRTPPTVIQASSKPLTKARLPIETSPGRYGQPTDWSRHAGPDGKVNDHHVRANPILRLAALRVSAAAIGIHSSMNPTWAPRRRRRRHPDRWTAADPVRPGRSAQRTGGRDGLPHRPEHHPQCRHPSRPRRTEVGQPAPDERDDDQRGHQTHSEHRVAGEQHGLSPLTCGYVLHEQSTCWRPRPWAGRRA